MATTVSKAQGSGPDLSSLPTDSITYEDLYARWERGNWSATELDFTEDARQWRDEFTEFERQAAIWNYCLFFWGEDAVADNLSPYIDAAPLEEQKYFLTTQQVDEARHSVFFKRFMHEVCGIGDGTASSGLQEIKPQLSPGFRKIFDRLDRMADELRADHSPAQLAAAVTLYHVVIEAALAQPGQHMICTYLEERNQLPAFREGMENVAADEQRHIGFGVKLLSDLNREDPVRVPAALHGAGSDAAELGRNVRDGLRRLLRRRGRGRAQLDGYEAALGGPHAGHPARPTAAPAGPVDA
jgi:ribonucleotide reductase beta subunit family protein with ferritin-like domain